MQRRSEGTTWVRSTRGQLKSREGSEGGQRGAISAPPPAGAGPRAPRGQLVPPAASACLCR
eukprot:2024499-Pyramimonas_sp.AAC.1